MKRFSSILIAVVVSLALAGAATAAPVTPEGSGDTKVSWTWLADAWSDLLSVFAGSETPDDDTGEVVVVPEDDTTTTTTPPTGGTEGRPGWDPDGNS